MYRDGTYFYVAYRSATGAWEEWGSAFVTLDAAKEELTHARAVYPHHEFTLLRKTLTTEVLVEEAK